MVPKCLFCCIDFDKFWEMFAHLKLESSILFKFSSQLLKSLSGSDKIRVEVMSQTEAPGLFCEALERHMKDVSMCEAVCLLVASLVLRYPAHGKTFVEENSIHDLLARVMVLHEKSSNVQVVVVIVNFFGCIEWFLVIIGWYQQALPQSTQKWLCDPILSEEMFPFIFSMFALVHTLIHWLVVLCPLSDDYHCCYYYYYHHHF